MILLSWILRAHIELIPSKFTLIPFLQMITAQEVTFLIKQSLPDAQIDVKDMGGGYHLEVYVVYE